MIPPWLATYDPHFYYRICFSYNVDVFVIQELNIFIIGYECDQGVRACGGRSGTELGPKYFRNLLQEENQKTFDELAK